MSNVSTVVIIFKQTLKDVEHLYRDVAGFDMSRKEFKNFCREAWKDDFHYLKIDEAIKATVIMFKQTLEDVEHVYIDLAGFNVSRRV